MQISISHLILFASNLLLPKSTATSKKVSCSFSNSLNISDGIFDQATRSYYHENKKYLQGQYGDFEYELIDGKASAVKKHIRGCVCQDEKCISLCCPLGQTYLEPGNCIPHQQPDKWQLIMDVLDIATNNKTSENVLASFGYFVRPKCMRMTQYYNSGDSFTILKVIIVVFGFGLLKLNQFRINNGDLPTNDHNQFKKHQFNSLVNSPSFLNKNS